MYSILMKDAALLTSVIGNYEVILHFATNQKVQKKTVLFFQQHCIFDHDTLGTFSTFDWFHGLAYEDWA